MTVHRIISAAIVLAFAVAAPAAHATFPGKNGKIAFGYLTTIDDGDGFSQALEAADPVDRKKGVALFSCDVHRGAELPAGCALDVQVAPAWSADGRLIAYDAGTQIAVRNTITGVRTLLPRLGRDMTSPAFSPAGTRVVATVRDGSGFSLFVIRRATGQVRLLARNAASPDWSSRDRIAFTRGGRLWVVRPDGHGAHPVSGKGASDPSWAPSGRTLLYSAKSHAYAVRADGRRRRLLTKGVCDSPTLSPDGRFLLCSTSALELYRLHPRRYVRTIVESYSGDTDETDISSGSWQPVR